MTRIDFYVLPTASEQRWLQTVCKLVEKAHASGKPVFVHTDNEQTAKHIDSELWCFKADSFIPHRTLTPATKGPGIESATSPAISSNGGLDTEINEQGSLYHSRSHNVVENVDIICGHTPTFGPDSRQNGILINLAQRVPSFFSRFERTLEIVTQDEEQRARSRQRYTYYRERGYPMQHFNLG